MSEEVKPQLTEEEQQLLEDILNNRKNVPAIISDIIMVTYKYSFENNYEVQIDNWRNPDFKMLVDDRGWVDKQLEKKYA